MKAEVEIYKPKVRLKNFLRFIIAGLSLFVIFFLVREVVSNVDSITKISQSSGIFGPIVLIILISLGILFSPIPSVIFIITAGYLYGVWTGALYSYLGHLLAATSAFAFFKSFEIKNESKRYRKYKSLVEKNKKILYLFYTIPILPMFLITMISASSKIEWKKFLEIITISFIPAILFFSFFGNKISERNILEIGIFAGVIIIMGIIIVKLIQDKKKRTFHGYPSLLKNLRPKRKHKYVKFNLQKREDDSI